MRLSVIIVNYNVRHFLEQCLRSVYKALGTMEAEVFVVDNSSVDGSVQMVNDLFPSVKLIVNKENQGFSKANNQAIKQSSGEYILLLNPDTVVPENAFIKCVEFMDSYPDAGALGVHMIDGQGKFLPESKRGLPTPEVALYKMMGLNKLFPHSKKFGNYHLSYLDELKTHQVDVLSGAYMLLRKNAIERTGMLDETFFMYGEDIDLSYRITQSGYKNYYYPDVTIIHYKGESTKKRTANYVKLFYKAMIIFAEKHYAGRYQKGFILLIQLAIYLRAAVAIIANFLKSYWMVMLEAVLIFLSMYALKEYWEEHIKYIKSYPAAMTYIHLPYYTVVWLMSLGISGSYKHPFQFGRIIRGILFGAALIFMIYGLLPNHLHFSRGIILFGTLLVTAMLILWRTLYHLIRYRSVDFSHRDQTRSILVGKLSKWMWVNELLSGSGKNYQKIGFVNEQNRDHPNWLGTAEQLKEIVRIFQVNEIIFNASDMDSEEIISWMNLIGPQVSYYIIPSDTEFVIGSHSKNISGLYFGQQIDLNLSKPEIRRQKRALDVLFSLLLILLSPVLFWFKRNKKYWSDCVQVLTGNKTWLGYAEDHTELPAQLPGVMNSDYQSGTSEQPKKVKIQLDRLLARNYRPGTELPAILHYVFNL